MCVIIHSYNSRQLKVKFIPENLISYRFIDYLTKEGPTYLCRSLLPPPHILGHPINESPKPEACLCGIGVRNYVRSLLS